MANFVSPNHIQIQIGLVLLVRPNTPDDTSQPCHPPILHPLTGNCKLPECSPELLPKAEPTWSAGFGAVLLIQWGGKKGFTAAKFITLHPLTGICYHTVVSKPLPQIPIDGNLLSRSCDWLPYFKLVMLSWRMVPLKNTEWLRKVRTPAEKLFWMLFGRCVLKDISQTPYWIIPFWEFKLSKSHGM